MGSDPDLFACTTLADVEKTRMVGSFSGKAWGAPFIRPLTDFILALPNHLYNFREREPSEETHVTDKSVI